MANRASDPLAELWVRPEHGGYGTIKPQAGLSNRLEQLGRNAMTRNALAAARSWVLLPAIRPKACRLNSATSGFM